MGRLSKNARMDRSVPGPDSRGPVARRPVGPFLVQARAGRRNAWAVESSWPTMDAASARCVGLVTVWGRVARVIDQDEHVVFVGTPARRS